MLWLHTAGVGIYEIVNWTIYCVYFLFWWRKMDILEDAVALQNQQIA